MRILMLGWEFPPFIAGGLGTACYGMTKALDRLGHEVLFVLPRPAEAMHASHVRLLSPTRPAGAPSHGARRGAADGARPDGSALADDGLAPDDRSAAESLPAYSQPGFEHVTFRSVPSTRSSPYPAFTTGGNAAPRAVSGGSLGEPSDSTSAWDEFDDRPLPIGGAPEGHGHAAPPPAASSSFFPDAPRGGPASPAYGGDVVGDAERYARMVVGMCRRERFDVIHAHDWMTFPAGLALAQATGKPLVAHVHSTEFDRSGEHVNQRVYEIERRGMMGALRVIAVSMLTRSICVRRYGIDPGKIEAVWNGIDGSAAQPPPGASVTTSDKIVLFLGRITMQKGPEYFIAAARRVLEKVPRAKFLIAGSGDMATRMIELAASMGIGHRVLFTGFLRGPQVDRIFRMADCYVMPSVSEPFGIAPLEAMRNDTPVIISKQSGVSEALTHVLKVDFWDVDEMANKIVAVLRHPPLSQTLREHGSFELRKLTWEGAARRYLQIYGEAVEAQGRAVALSDARR